MGIIFMPELPNNNVETLIRTIRHHLSKGYTTWTLQHTTIYAHKFQHEALAKLVASGELVQVNDTTWKRP